MARRKNVNTQKTTEKTTQKSKQRRRSYSGPKMLPSGNLQDRAQREIGLANDPLLEEIANQQNQALDTFQETNEAYRNIGQGLRHDLNRLPDVVPQYRAISRGLSQNIDSLPDFNAFTPDAAAFGAEPNNTAESQAAANLMGLYGQGAQQQLAGIGMRDVAYTNSVGQQAAVDLSNRRANALETYNDLIEQLKQEKRNVTEDVGAQTQQRLDQLRDTRFTQGLQLGQFGLEQQAQESSDEASEWLIEYLQNKIDNRGGRNRGGGGNTWGDVGRGAADAAGDGDGKGRGQQAGGGNQGGGASSNPSGFGGSAGFGTNIPAHLQGKYNRLTDEIQEARSAIEGEFYDPTTGKWYILGAGGSGGRVPVQPINRPLRRRRRIEQKIERKRRKNKDDPRQA